MVDKDALRKHCLDLIEARIANLGEYLEAIHQSKQNETKSSAGDKYETGRAMMQLEEDKINAQLALTQQTYQQLAQVQFKEGGDQVQLGSLVTTNKRIYFLTVGLGKIEWEDQVVFCISPMAPIGKQLWGKVTGERFDFNGQEDQILALS
ncbi:MAG: hypothetical protein AAF433_07035 [Bacteroidota bacterium]